MDWFGPVPPGVLEYPLVQYIPLPVRTLVELAAPVTTPALACLADAAALARACGALGVVPPPWDGERMHLLLTGATAGRCYYRADRAAILGTARPAIMQLLSLPRRRIYKERVVFIVFDPSGRELCRCDATGVRW